MVYFDWGALKNNFLPTTFQIIQCEHSCIVMIPSETGSGMRYDWSTVTGVNVSLQSIRLPQRSYNTALIRTRKPLNKSCDIANGSVANFPITILNAMSTLSPGYRSLIFFQSTNQLMKVEVHANSLRHWWITQFAWMECRNLHKEKEDLELFLASANRNGLVFGIDKLMERASYFTGEMWFDCADVPDVPRARDLAPCTGAKTDPGLRPLHPLFFRMIAAGHA
jgi:hypothetical protein